MTIDDAKYATLTGYGYGGTISDAYRSYLLAETSSSGGVVNDLERKKFSALGYTGGINDMWNSYLEDLGYTGALDDKQKQFWEDGYGFTPFVAELTHTAVPQRAASGTTATFTRATTATFTDFEGVLRTAPAGCARFVGARFVRNLLTYTEDFSNAAWLKANITVAADATTAPDGTATATKITATAAAATYVIGVHNPFAGTAVICSIYIKKSSGATDLNQFAIYNASTAATLQSCTINYDTGVVTQVTGTGSSVTDEGDGWYRLQIVATSGITAGNNINFYIGSLGGAQTANEAIFVWHPQLEDITGRADQTTPSEYVSVGVESAPYHGAGADGCQFFDTDLDGNPIPAATNLGYLAEGARTNKALRSDDYNQAVWNVAGGNFVATDSGIASHIAGKNWQKIEVATSAATNISQAIVATGTTETLSVYLKKGNTATDANRIGIYNQSTASDLYYVGINYDTGAVTELFGSGSYAVELIGTGEYRLSITVSSGISVGNTINVYHGYNGNPGVAGDYFYAIGSMLEAGSFASTYIPTTTAAVTRNADQLYYTGGDIANIKSVAARGTLMPVGTANATSKVSWALSDGSVNNYACVFTRNNGMAKEVRYEGYASGAHQWVQAAAAQYVEGVPFNTSTSFAINDVKMAKDGIGQTPDTTAATMPTITRLEIGMIAGILQLNGNTGPIYGWTRNLSQSELNAVTS